MEPLPVVVALPFLNALLCVRQGREPQGVQAVSPQPGVERFEERVIRGRAGSGEVDLHPVEVGPVIEQAAAELRSVV